MDWDGIQTAYFDLQRKRLGLPSREEEAALRAKREQEAAAAASALETQGANRDLVRAKIAALPEEQRLAREREVAMTSYYTARAGAAENPQPRADQTETQILGNGNIGIVNRTTGEVRDTGVKAQAKPATGGASDLPRTGWKDVYDSNGRLVGSVHAAAGYRSAESLGLPPGSRTSGPTGSERDALALGGVSVRAGDNMRKALDAVRVAEKENPTDPATWTGPIAGRAGNAYRGIVSSAGPGGDFDQARNEARSLVYALSGKQINQSEQAWLDRILPNLRDPGVDQQLERFDRFVNFMREAKRQGYSDPFAVAQTQMDATLPSAMAPAASHGVPGATDPLEGRTATNAAGQKIVRKGGRWVPLQ